LAKAVVGNIVKVVINRQIAKKRLIVFFIILVVTVP